jgi:signal peptidase I
MSTVKVPARSPWVAVLLSLAATGLGQIYCGRIVRGLVLFLGSSLFGPVIVLAALLPPSTAVLVGLFLALGMVLGIYVFAIVDAYREARRCRDHYELKEYNRPIVYALFILVGLTYPVGVVHYVRSSVLEAFEIPTHSEVPNLLPGDHVLVNKTTYQRRFPRRGDLIVFRAPSEPGRNWVKRVIALPGDRVAVRGNEVIVNGQKLPRDRVPPASLGTVALDFPGEAYEETNAGSRYLILLAAKTDPLPDYAEAKVPEGTIFVLGDNRNVSRDSREFGFVAIGEVIGDVQYVYYPALSWSRFGARSD